MYVLVGCGFIEALYDADLVDGQPGFKERKEGRRYCKQVGKRTFLELNPGSLPSYHGYSRREKSSLL